MPYQLESPEVLQVGVCSTDNIHYDIRVKQGGSCDSGVRSQMATRNGNTIQAVFNNFLFDCQTGCPGTLTVTGVIGAAENQVTLTLQGTNIQPCGAPADPSYYGPGSFTAVVVALVLSGNCPNDLPPLN